MLLLPARCPGCDHLGPAPCPACAEALRALAARPPAVAGAVVAVPFAGVAHRLVTGLKYRGRRTVAPVLADVLAGRLLTDGALAGPDRPEVVTWAPTTAGHRRRRGCDHAEVLARVLARRLGLACRPLLRRVDDHHQTGQSRAARLVGPSLVGRPGARGRRVLVVDDVVTTGATMRAAAAALRASGAVSVLAAAVAATPSPGSARGGAGGERPVPPGSRR